MTDKKKLSPEQQAIKSLAFQLIQTDSIRLMLDMFNLAASIQGERKKGLYEAIDFSHTLELMDSQGKKAVHHKRETVKLLQDHVAAYLDRVWGIGEIFADYKCSPGKAVDRYRCGHAYCVLISLREVKRKGEVLRIKIDRTVKDGYRVKTGWCQTAVLHHTKRFRTAVIFPKDRHPQKVSLIEEKSNKTKHLGEEDRAQLPDGRVEYFWETLKPKLFETYTLRWTW